MPITQENLFSSMQDWLRKCDMKILGYHNKIKAQKAQKCFCESLHLLEFLDIFSYDLVYGSQEFFLAVAKQSQRDLGVNQCEFEALLQDSLAKLDKLTKLRKARIDFTTRYRIRWHTANPLIPEPQYTQATLSLAEILQIAKEVVLKHYAKYNGRLHIWGDILEYYVFYDGTRYEFDTQGNLKENPQDKLAQGVISVTLSV